MRTTAANPLSAPTAGPDVLGSIPSEVSSQIGEINLTKRIGAAFKRIIWTNSNRSGNPVPNKTPSTSPLSKISQVPRTKPPKKATLGTTSNAADTQPGLEGAEGDVAAPQAKSAKARRSKATPKGRSSQKTGVASPQYSRLGTPSPAPTFAEGGDKVSGAATNEFNTSRRPAVEASTSTLTYIGDPTGPVAKTEFELQAFHHHRQRSIFERIDSALGGTLCFRAKASLERSASVRSLPIVPLKQPSEVPLRNRFSLSELREGLLSSNGQRSARLDALDCTSRLSDRTGPQAAGAFSDVSKARLSDRLVAVKELKSTNMDGPDEIRMRKRLGREIYVWAGLHHPHVLEFIGFAFEDVNPCLISPWCQNGNLLTYLQKHKGANRPLLVRQIAEGLKYLHNQNPPIIHGDFKTANVLITDEHVAKICDFGGSKRLGDVNTGLTTTQSISATIRYSAPEIVLKGEPQTLESDVYSFACVALETMTGKSPFWKFDVYEIVFKAVSKATPSPDDHSELKDETLWELLRGCWKHERLERPTMINVCRKLADAGYGPSTTFYSAE